jgi:hypothetical protein
VSDIDHYGYDWGVWSKSGKTVQLSSNQSIAYKMMTECIPSVYVRPKYRRGIKAEMVKLYQPTAPSAGRRIVLRNDEKDDDMLTVLERIDKMINGYQDHEMHLKLTAILYYREFPKLGYIKMCEKLGIGKTAYYERINKIREHIENCIKPTNGSI